MDALDVLRQRLRVLEVFLANIANLSRLRRFSFLDRLVTMRTNVMRLQIVHCWEYLDAEAAYEAMFNICALINLDLVEILESKRFHFCLLWFLLCALEGVVWLILWLAVIIVEVNWNLEYFLYYLHTRNFKGTIKNELSYPLKLFTEAFWKSSL